MTQRSWMSEIRLCLGVHVGYILGSTDLYSTITDRYRLDMGRIDIPKYTQDDIC
jgi:hypothetical protein